MTTTPDFHRLKDVEKMNEVEDNTTLETDEVESTENIGEEQAVLTWLYTFPQVQQVTSDFILLQSWHNNQDIASCILNVATEIYDVSYVQSKNSSVIWGKIREISGNIGPSSLNKGEKLFTLMELLSHSVSEDCAKRGAYISRILKLGSTVQRTLMQIIEGRDTQRNTEDEFTENDQSTSLFGKENYDTQDVDFDLSPVKLHRSPLTPKMDTISCLRNSSPFSQESFKQKKPFSHHSPDLSITRLKIEMDDIREQNDKYSKDICLMHARETELNSMLEESEAKNRAARMLIESEGIKRERKMHDEYEQKIASVEKELQSCLIHVDENVDYKEEVTKLQDELDILQHNSGKLTHAEEQVQRLKQKIQLLGESNDALNMEQNSHNEAVTKCLQLENELALLQPLRRQLEEYKCRSVNSDVKLTECEDDMKSLNNEIDKLKAFNKELQKGAHCQQSEIVGLQKNLIQEGADCQVNKIATLGEGITELNPVLQEEILRLRNENVRLKAFVAKREDDSVQLMEEKLDDVDRLGKKFKEQYLLTKTTLGNTQNELQACFNKLSIQEKKTQDLQYDNNSLKQNIEHARITHNEVIQEAGKTLQHTKFVNEKKFKEEKESIIVVWTSKLQEEFLCNAEKFAKFEEETTETEKRMNASLISKSEDMQKQKLEYEEMICVTTKEKEAEILRLEEEATYERKVKKTELLRLEEEATYQRNKLINKGKNMLKTSKEVAEKETSDLNFAHEKKVDSLLENEKRIKERIRLYEQQLNLQVGEITQLSSENDVLTNNCERFKKEKNDLQNEIDRLRRKLSGGFGSDSNIQIQFNRLQKEYNDILRETRGQKKRSSETHNFSSNLNNSPSSLHSDDASIFDNSQSYNTSNGGDSNKSTLGQFREEYEEVIASLTDEKRELLMQNSAAITENQKEKQRSRDLESEVDRLKSEGISNKLRLERANRYNSDLTPVQKYDTPSPINKLILTNDENEVAYDSNLSHQHQNHFSGNSPRKKKSINFDVDERLSRMRSKWGNRMVTTKKSDSDQTSKKKF